jgi:hypothetical protein
MYWSRRNVFWRIKINYVHLRSYLCFITVDTLTTGIFFLYIYHKSLIQSKVTFFKKSGPEDHFLNTRKYCVIKCIQTKRVLKHEFASPVFHNCNTKTQQKKRRFEWPVVKVLKILGRTLYIYSNSTKQWTLNKLEGCDGYPVVLLDITKLTDNLHS